MDIELRIPLGGESTNSVKKGLDLEKYGLHPQSAKFVQPFLTAVVLEALAEYLPQLRQNGLFYNIEGQ